MKNYVFKLVILLIPVLICLGFMLQPNDDPRTLNDPLITYGNPVATDAVYNILRNHNIDSIINGSPFNYGAVWTGSNYIVSRFNANMFYRMRENWTFRDSFSVTGATWGADGFKDMVFAKGFLWGVKSSLLTPTGGNIIYKVDTTTRSQVGTITLPAGINAIAVDWDVARQGFWVSTANFGGVLRCYDTLGVAIPGTDIPTVAGGFYGVAYDNATAGGPYLWLHKNPVPANPTQTQLVRFRVSSTPVRLDSGTITIPLMTAVTGGGLAFSSSLIPGKTVLIAVTQGTPDRLVVFEAGDLTPSGSCNITANTWVNRPVVPNALYFGTSAWIGDTLYFQAPTSTGVGTATVYRYTYGGTWTTGVPMPGPLVGGSMVNCGGKLYYIGGSTASILTGGTTVYEYTPSSGTWATKAPLPVALSAHQAVSWGDSAIIVVGGPYTGAATNLAHHYYRPTSNTWGTTMNSLPAGQGRRTFGMAISGNKIVLSSGFNTVFLKNTYVGTIGSNASVITWAPAPDVPTVHTGLSRPGSTAFGNFFFLVCGERGGPGGYYDTTHVFSISSNSWVGMINNIPYKRSNIMGHITAKCINDTLSLFCPAGYGTATGSGTGVATDLFHITRTGILTSTGSFSSNVPDTYTLSQNYPNPFNPTTRITFSIPKSSFVSLKVYDVAGKELKTLVNEIRGANTYTVDFDASNLGSGVYFYTLKSENFVETKKMIVVK